MKQDPYITFGNGYTSINFPTSDKETFPRISSAEYAFKKGEKNAFTYGEERLLEMLKSGRFEEIFEAFGAIGKRKLKSALPYLKEMALYDEDKGIQQEAIQTIRRIGGKKGD